MNRKYSNRLLCKLVLHFCCPPSDAVDPSDTHAIATHAERINVNANNFISNKKRLASTSLTSSRPAVTLIEVVCTVSLLSIATISMLIMVPHQDKSDAELRNVMNTMQQVLMQARDTARINHQHVVVRIGQVDRRQVLNVQTTTLGSWQQRIEPDLSDEPVAAGAILVRVRSTNRRVDFNADGTASRDTHWQISYGTANATLNVDSATGRIDWS